MFCQAYPLRSKGQRLPADQVRALGRRGWLELQRRDDGAPVLIARLISERGGVQGELHCASVTRITREGLMVAGWEAGTKHRQAWWCMPVTSVTGPPAGATPP
ncbi:MAG TPA: hypothetical protein VGE22_12400 [Solimonas sp.]